MKMRTIKFIAKVRKVSPEAANWLRKEFPKTKYYRELGIVGLLSSWFIWGQTPQGHQYWHEIAAKMGERI